jgi:hypothetical protein
MCGFLIRGTVTSPTKVYVGRWGGTVATTGSIRLAYSICEKAYTFNQAILAQSIAAFALALDVSTVSAIADDTFTASHQNLARGPRQNKHEIVWEGRNRAPRRGTLAVKGRG